MNCKDFCYAGAKTKRQKKIKANKQKRVICKCKRTAIIPSGSKWLKIKDISPVEIYASFMLSYSPSPCWALLKDRRWWQSFEIKARASSGRRHSRWKGGCRSEVASLWHFHFGRLLTRGSVSFCWREGWVRSPFVSLHACQQAAVAFSEARAQPL